MSSATSTNLNEVVVISGTGFYAPPDVISNEALVSSYNQYAARYNQQHAEAISAKTLQALPLSSAEFILKASGIKRRHVIDKKNILDIDIMRPQVQERPNEMLSLQAEFALKAIEQALSNAKKKSSDIDAVIVACTNTQRPYPGIAIEIQQALGIKGWAFDMRVACSSVTFGLQMAGNATRSQQAGTILVVSPEISSAQLNFRDRDSHFIFGDAAVAAVVEKYSTCLGPHPFEIVSSKLLTQFSNHIRSNDGFINHIEPPDESRCNPFFTQQGRSVFKEIVPLVPKVIQAHLAAHDYDSTQLKRLWLHQANKNMNQLIAQKVLGREATLEEAPLILEEYANTASAGSLIAFHLHHQDLASNDLGVLCSFGAGYSVGSLILKKM